MRWYLALALTAVLFIVSVVLTGIAGFNLVLPMVLATAAWAAVDSHKIRLKDYKTGIAYGPVVLFIAVSLLWIIGFPWYLIARHRIISGTLPLKASQGVGSPSVTS